MRRAGSLDGFGVTVRRWLGACLCCIGVVAAVDGSAATRESRHLTVAGQRRDYILVRPDASPQAARPIVVILHGHLGTAANALGSGISPSPLSAWLGLADREGLYLVALQGLRGGDGHTGWNDCRNDATGNPRSDDVAFASAVVQSLVDAGQVDRRRIYVMGMSNGAMMSYRLAAEMKPAPAAIAAVSGTMAVHSQCGRPARPVSVLLIAGTDDPLVPYAGGEVGFGNSKGRGLVMSAAATRDYWLQVDGIRDAKPVSYAFPHHGDDATSAARETYGPDAGPQVELVTVRHAGHVEPSVRFHYGPLYTRLVGIQNRDFESAEEAWRFFGTKSLP